MKLQSSKELVTENESGLALTNMQVTKRTSKKIKKVFYKNGWPETITIKGQMYNLEYPKILNSKTAEKLISNYDKFIGKGFYGDYFGDAKFVAMDKSIKYEGDNPFMSLEVKGNIYDVIIRKADVNFKAGEKIIFNYLFYPRNSKTDLRYEVKKQIIESLERNISQGYEMDITI